MSFKQKTWKDRISEHPTRRTLTDVSNNTTKTFDVAREEGTISQKGDPYSAANMNDLESRIANGFSTLSQDSLKMSSSNPSSDSIKFGINANGQYGYIKPGASKVTPFRNPTGNASPSDVLSGKTFSTASLENASGTRIDLGSEPEMKGGTLYNGDVYLYPIPGGDGRDYGIKRGVHASPSNIAGWSGGTLFTKSQYDAHYNQGVTDADNRANSNSTNYKSGYNAGYSAGKGAAGNITLYAVGNCVSDPNQGSSAFLVIPGALSALYSRADVTVGVRANPWKHGALNDDRSGVPNQSFAFNGSNYTSDATASFSLGSNGLTLSAKMNGGTLYYSCIRIAAYLHN